MKTLLLMSLLIFTFAAPGFAARDPDARRGFRRMVRAYTVFVVMYFLWVSLGHTKYFPPTR